MALGKAYDKYFSLKNEPIFFFFNGEWFGGNLLGFFPSPSQGVSYYLVSYLQIKAMKM